MLTFIRPLSPSAPGNLIDPRRSAHFYRLMAQMRMRHPDESQLMFLAFDLLHQDGVDLRPLRLSERKRDLRRLCRKSPVPFMREVQTFPNGTLLFDHSTSLALRVSCPSA
jgi:ATP-dependent DNA ligase